MGKIVEALQVAQNMKESAIKLYRSICSPLLLLL